MMYLVYAGDPVSPLFLRVFECVGADFHRSLLSNEFDRLHDSVFDFVFDSGILSFRIFPNGDNVDPVIEGLVSLDTFAWPHIRIQAKRFAQH